MEHITEFFDTSSINGMSMILRTKSIARIFWIVVIIGGFSGAVFMIYESFGNWRQNPISTTIKTFPISNITFPNITVCPPRNLFLNLNKDIKNSENITMKKNIRNKLIDFAQDVIQDKFYEDILKNISKLEDPDRYKNWYHRRSTISIPKQDDTWDRGLSYVVDHYTTSGNISTKYFGEKFDADKIEGHLHFNIRFRKAKKQLPFKPSF